LHESVRSKDKEPYDNKMGTHDISVLTIDDGVFEVKATGGDVNLGKQMDVSVY
jgi:hypothetical protein